MAAWLTFPGSVPDDEEIVWIRIKYYYSAPFLAEYDTAAQTFTSVTNSIVYPAWAVARWRSQ